MDIWGGWWGCGELCCSNGRGFREESPQRSTKGAKWTRKIPLTHWFTFDVLCLLCSFAAISPPCGESESSQLEKQWTGCGTDSTRVHGLICIRVIREIRGSTFVSPLQGLGWCMSVYPWLRHGLSYAAPTGLIPGFVVLRGPSWAIFLPPLVIRASTFIRHSSFGFRHSAGAA